MNKDLKKDTSPSRNTKVDPKKEITKKSTDKSLNQVQNNHTKAKQVEDNKSPKSEKSLKGKSEKADSKKDLSKSTKDPVKK